MDVEHVNLRSVFWPCSHCTIFADTLGSKMLLLGFCSSEKSFFCKWQTRAYMKRMTEYSECSESEGKRCRAHFLLQVFGEGYDVNHWELNDEVKLFSSVAQLCPTFWDSMDCSMPGLPIHHQLPEFTQTHVHWVSDAIQPSDPRSSPSPPGFNLSQYQSLQMKRFFASGGQSIGVLASASVLPMNIQDWFPLGWTGLIFQSKGLSRLFYNTIVQKHRFFGAQLSL